VFSEIGTAYWLTLEGHSYWPLLQKEGSGNGIPPDCCLFFLPSHRMCKKPSWPQGIMLSHTGNTPWRWTL